MGVVELKAMKLRDFLTAVVNGGGDWSRSRDGHIKLFDPQGVFVAKIRPRETAHHDVWRKMLRDATRPRP